MLIFVENVHNLVNKLYISCGENVAKHFACREKYKYELWWWMIYHWWFPTPLDFICWDDSLPNLRDWLKVHPPPPTSLATKQPHKTRPKKQKMRQTPHQFLTIFRCLDTSKHLKMVRNRWGVKIRRHLGNPFRAEYELLIWHRIEKCIWKLFSGHFVFLALSVNLLDWRSKGES